MNTSKVINITVLLYVVSLAAFTLVLLNGCTNITKNEINFGETTLYFTKNVPRDQAQSLGDYLYEIGYLGETSSADARLDKTKEKYILHLNVMPELESNEQVILDVDILSNRISQKILEGATLEIILADANLTPYRTVTPRQLGKLAESNNNELFYTKNISEEESQKFIEYLKSNELWTSATDNLDQLDKNNETYIYRTNNKNFEADPSNAKMFSALASAKIFDGYSVAVEITDNQLRPITVVQNYDLGSLLEYENNKLFHSSSVTNYQANSLLDYLIAWNVFSVESQKGGLLTIEKDVYIFKLIIDENMYDNDETRQTLAVLGNMIRENVFPDEKVHVHIANPALETVSVVIPMASNP
ncbi:MAG: hypothetical protein FI718_01280 [SAR202 cluster bacterium]|nr:hypothetical protein [Chloroflexota bacterium]MQG38613.1 hypothetical protein [SAR202 cluster bacterium]|tara:strand:- start:8915 stop:9991 length:1077 start_codon:yes stop_codon:yes gene_type:complete